jgi:hypothetical protein
LRSVRNGPHSTGGDGWTFHGKTGYRRSVAMDGSGVSLGIVLVIVLSAAVLVIDISIILRAGLAHPIEFHRHSSQHRDDPMQHRFHRRIILNCDSLCGQQHATIDRPHVDVAPRRSWSKDCPVISLGSD